MMHKERYIGMLGLGSRSTVFYIEQLNTEFLALNGGYSTCPIKLLNANFDKINPFLPNNFKSLKKNLSPYLKELLKLNIDTLLIPNITLHETVDILLPNLDIKFSIIHPVENTIEKLMQKNQNEVLLIGSLYSMKARYIGAQLQENNIEVSLPIEKEIEFIDKLRQKVYLNKESQEDIDQFNELVKAYAINKPVVIACTELSIVLGDDIDNVYDMARIQIDEALKAIN